MAVHYEFCVDSAITPMAATVDDGTNSGTATVTTSTLYCATDLTTVLGSGIGKPLATELEARIDAVLTTNGSTISYSQANLRWTLAFGATCTVTLTSAAGQNLARWLGFTADHTNGAGSGYSVTLSGASSYTSNVRPYGIIVPTIDGRSQFTDEQERDGIVVESLSDDGTADYMAVDSADILTGWSQAFETDSPPTWTLTGPAQTTSGVSVFKRSANTAVPWSYQHAWEHMRAGGSLPFLCKDTGIGDDEVHEMRADGLTFKPTRAGAEDFSLWHVPFRTRLIGRL